MLVKVHWDQRKCMLPGPPRSQDFQNMLQRIKHYFRKAGFDILQSGGTWQHTFSSIPVNLTNMHFSDSVLAVSFGPKLLSESSSQIADLSVLQIVYFVSWF